MTDYTPAVSSFSRTFTIKGKAAPNHRPSYDACLIAGEVEQSLGDITKIECPDPRQMGRFKTIGSFRTQEGRPEIELTGQYALDLRSTLLRNAKQLCATDIIIKFSNKGDASILSEYTKLLVLIGAQATEYSTTALGAKDGTGNAAIMETVPFSADDMFEVVPLSFSKKADDLLTNEVVDMVVSSVISCGDVDAEDDGCDKVYGVTLAAGGSPSTPADLVYSLNRGVTWYTRDIDTLGVAEDASGIATYERYIVVVSEDSNSLHYTTIASVTPTTVPTWTEVTTGFVASKQPRSIFSTNGYVFIVGNGGYVYGTQDPLSGVSVLDAGVATADNLLSVHGLSDSYAVAVGNNGAVVFTSDGANWTSVQRPVGLGVNLTSVWVTRKNLWWVTASNGRLFYTLDEGATWTEKGFPGSGAGVAYKIVFSNHVIGYLSHSTATPRARLMRTLDGGYSWDVLPESNVSLPAVDRLVALAACENDPNFMVAGGLADNGSDGAILVGDA